MSSSQKVDKAVVYYVLGGAVLGAVAGYMVKKVGMKNIVNVLKAKNIIPENLMNTISEFTKKSACNDFDEDDQDLG